MRILGRLLVSAALLVLPVSAIASPLAFEDNKLNFRSCDGDHVTARWRESNFSLSLPGKSLGDAHPSISFVSWDGRCLTGRWDEVAGSFTLKGDGSESSSDYIGYVTWDGSKWAGMRAGSGFFVTRIADANEGVSTDRLQEIGHWLERRNAAFTPGAALGARLREAASQ